MSRTRIMCVGSGFGAVVAASLAKAGVEVVSMPSIPLKKRHDGQPFWPDVVQLQESSHDKQWWQRHAGKAGKPPRY